MFSQANFPAHNLGEGDGIESRLPFKIFSTILSSALAFTGYYSFLQSKKKIKTDDL